MTDLVPMSLLTYTVWCSLSLFIENWSYGKLPTKMHELLYLDPKIPYLGGLLEIGRMPLQYPRAFLNIQKGIFPCSSNCMVVYKVR